MSKDIDSLQELNGNDFENIRNNIQQMILDTYLPANGVDDTEEYISSADMLDTFRSVLEMEAEYLFVIMKELGFKTRLIEDSVYWMVKLST